MQQPRSLPPVGPLAAIDLGSNSFRLEIGQVEHGRYRRIDYLKETVRLGSGLDGDGRLTEEAATRGLECLARFARRLDGFAQWQVRAVATQTLREASNRDEFLERARIAIDHAVEVISGREEARLVYAGVAHLQPSTQRRLVLDIGGRSTELILGRDRTPLAAESFGTGCVELAMRYFADGRLTAAAFRAAQVAAGAQFAESLATFAPSRWDEALGSSGTVGALSQVLAAEGITDGRITPEALAWCTERCIGAGHVERLDLRGLKLDRRPVIAGGLAILSTLCEVLGIGTLMPARGALRQGVIVELDERLRAAHRKPPTDMRDRSVADLQRRFGVDVPQASRVLSVALSLYDQVCPGCGTADEARRELGWAAALHEMGMLVSHHDHHRHSAYLLSHVDAAGFSQSQQRLLGLLVLGQRGGMRKCEGALAEAAFARQLLCLRLAIIACHRRADPDLKGWHLRARGVNAELELDAGAHVDPRTHHLLREECDRWARSQALVLELNIDDSAAAE